jgi:hypothetical protein
MWAQFISYVFYFRSSLTLHHLLNVCCFRSSSAAFRLLFGGLYRDIQLFLLRLSLNIFQLADRMFCSHSLAALSAVV